MNSRKDRKIDKLYQVYLDPSSGLFLDSNAQRIHAKANRDAALAPVTYAEIDEYKKSLEDISRARQRRAIGNRQRHLSQRKWLVWAPKCVLLGRQKSNLCVRPTQSDPIEPSYFFVVFFSNI